METSIISAIQKGYFQQVRLLVKSGLNVNTRDHQRRTPLIYCTLVDDEPWGVGLARILLEAGAQGRLVDRAGLGPLHYASILDKIGILRVFLGAADFDINQREFLGNTALHYAAATGSTAAVEALVASCVKYGYCVDALNRNCQTPEDMALENGHDKCAQVIQDAKKRLRDKKVVLRAVSVPDLSALRNDTTQSPILHVYSDPTRKSENGVSRDRRDENKVKRLASSASFPGCCSFGNNDAISSALETGMKRKLTAASFSGENTVRTVREKCWSSNSETSKQQKCDSSQPKVIRGYHAVIKRLQDIQPICAAPARDPRANPAKILGQNPCDIFALHSNQTTAHSLQDGNWRCMMNTLYDSFYFQFSDTYRSTVKHIAGNSDDTGSLNKITNGDSDFRQRQSQVVRKTSSLCRASTGRFHGTGDSRKSSVVAVVPRLQRRQSQQTTTSGSSSDRNILPAL